MTQTIVNSDSATASSFNQNQKQIPEADNAIDGNVGTMWFSDQEDYPWIQIKLARTAAVTELDFIAQYVQYGTINWEIRAGMESVPDGFKGQLEVNKKVGSFTGSVNGKTTYNIKLDAPTTALYVTLQRKCTLCYSLISEVKFYEGKRVSNYR